MFRDFLWLLHTKQSYDMQKRNGLAGLIALFAVFLLIFKWNDWFAPLFFGLGLDKVPALFNADHGEFHAMTFIHMMAWLLVLALVIGTLMVIGYLLFMTPLVFIFVAPFLLVAMLVQMVISFIRKPFGRNEKQPSSLTDTSASHEVNTDEAMLRKVQELINQGDAVKFDSQQATEFLNRATSITEEQPWLIAKDSKNTWYVLGNNPLPVHASYAYRPGMSSLFNTLRIIFAETKANRQMRGMETMEESWEHLAGNREIEKSFLNTYAQVENPKTLKNLCVASLALTVRLGEQDVPYFHFTPGSEVSLQEEIWDMTIFKVDTADTESLFKSIALQHDKFVETIHNQHVAFYAYPYFSEVEYSYLAEGGLGFFKAIESVKDAKKYNYLYHPHVYTLALEEAHNYQSKWAISYLEGYQS